MYSISKILIGGAIALAMCVGEAALFASSTSASEPTRTRTEQRADQNLDRSARSAYHQQLLGRAPRRDALIAQR
jgi:hypothetical protein